MLTYKEWRKIFQPIAKKKAEERLAKYIKDYEAFELMLAKKKQLLNEIRIIKAEAQQLRQKIDTHIDYLQSQILSAAYKSKHLGMT